MISLTDEGSGSVADRMAKARAAKAAKSGEAEAVQAPKERIFWSRGRQVKRQNPKAGNHI